jgi:hypothetical protein
VVERDGLVGRELGRGVDVPADLAARGGALGVVEQLRVE